MADAWSPGQPSPAHASVPLPPRLHRRARSVYTQCYTLPSNEHTARQRHPHIPLPSLCTVHLHTPSLSLSLSPRTLRQGGARGAGAGRGAASVHAHAGTHTHSHTHTLSHAPPAPLDVPSPPRPRRAERGGTRQWQMTAAPRCAPPPRASLSSPFFSLMPPPHAPRQADRAPSQAAGLSPFFLFLFFASSTPSHPDTIGRPPSRGRSSSRCK